MQPHHDAAPEPKVARRVAGVVWVWAEGRKRIDAGDAYEPLVHAPVWATGAGA